jgi:Holliday junction DNA helicase RuvA
MIAKLYGIVDCIIEDGSSFLLNVNGVCYEILCSTQTSSNIAVNASVAVWTEHIIREDKQMLCGFLSFTEQSWFREIIGVQGVGPKVALSILSALSVRDIASAIVNKNPNLLTVASGVGKRVAERIVTELKNSKLLVTSAHYGANANDPASQPPTDAAYLSLGFDACPGTTDYEAIEALVSLGYNRAEARAAVSKVDGRAERGLQTESLLKEALVFLAPMVSRE